MGQYPSSALVIAFKHFTRFVKHFFSNTHRLIPRKVWAKAVFPKEWHAGVECIMGAVRKGTLNLDLNLVLKWIPNPVIRRMWLVGLKVRCAC